MRQRSLIRALLLGGSAGLRSMTAPAVLSWMQQSPAARPLPLLRPHAVRRTLGALAVGEMIFDKTPLAPDRIALSVLPGRLLSGGMCGAAVVPEDARNGAAIGIGAALVASFGGWAVRRSVQGGAARFLLAIAEDTLALGLATLGALEEEDQGEQSRAA